MTFPISWESHNPFHGSKPPTSFPLNWSSDFFRHMRNGILDPHETYAYTASETPYQYFFWTLCCQSPTHPCAGIQIITHWKCLDDFTYQILSITKMIWRILILPIHSYVVNNLCDHQSPMRTADPLELHHQCLLDCQFCTIFRYGFVWKSGTLIRWLIIILPINRAICIYIYTYIIYIYTSCSDTFIYRFPKMGVPPNHSVITLW